MKIVSFIKSRQIRLSITVSIIIMVFFSIIATMISIYLQPGSFMRFIQLIKANPFLFVLNYLPFLLLELLVFFLTSNPVFSSIIPSAVLILFSYVNREKIILRQDPFIPNDFSLVSEVTGIIQKFPSNQIKTYAFVAVAFIVAVTVSILFFRCKKIKSIKRMIGLIAVICAAFILNSTLYTSDKLYGSFAVDGNIYFEVNQFDSKGFMYSFIYKFNTMKIKKPDGYDKQYFADIDKNFKEPSHDTKELPNIIMILGESFSDLSNNKHFDFTNYTDPLKNWKEITSGPNCVSGHIVVATYGGGTSNTEFDILTGYSTRYLLRDGISYNYIRKKTDSIPNRLKDIGYDTLAIHPGFPWFYNRENVYPNIGLDNFISLKSFQGKEKYKGGYIADKYAFDSIIDNFDDHFKQSKSPFFEFCVTIQNHGPYDQKYKNVENMFDCDVSLTDSEKSLLNNYFTGVNDADEQIKRLTDYFENSDKPVAIVYFGDHLPPFSNGMDFFSELNYNIDANGTYEQQLNLYATPYLIWENNAAEKISPIKEVAQKIGLTKTDKISSNFLGTSLLELFGLDDISPFFKFSTAMRKETPVITGGIYVLPDGEYKDALKPEQLNNISKLQKWQYYKMFDGN
ncbi:MAG: LTA synthase family protein [Clostridia bacterium]|nr:LTA synthase family protein [Clostridia bacterium]